jgi:Flp pilus assembly pilin Flp
MVAVVLAGSSTSIRASISTIFSTVATKLADAAK